MASRALSALFGAGPRDAYRLLSTGESVEICSHGSSTCRPLTQVEYGFAVSLWVVVPLCCWLVAQWRAGAFREVRPCPCGDADGRAQDNAREDRDAPRVTQLSVRNAQGGGAGARNGRQSRGQPRPPGAQSTAGSAAGAGGGGDEPSPGPSAAPGGTSSKSSGRFVSGSTDMQASEGGWVCAQCTLQNSAGDQTCQACGAPKPAVVV